MKKLLLILVLHLLSSHAFAQCNPNVGAPIQYLCGNNQLTLVASSGYTSYLWSTGATTASIIVDEIGTYTVKIIGSNNCLVFKSVEVQRLKNAKFSLAGSGKCDSSSYLFQNQSSVLFSSLQSFRWEFGDDSVYQSASPPNLGADLAGWTNFSYIYRKNGSFNPKLILKITGQSCPDTFSYAETENTLPQNLLLRIDIRSRINKFNNTPADSACAAQGKICLYNSFPLNANEPYRFLWDFADNNIQIPGLDKILNDTAPCYTYAKTGHYFPTLTITCPGQGNRTYNFWSRIDTIGLSDNVYIPAPANNPRINTMNGILYGSSDSISRYRYVIGNNGSPKDSIVSHWNWFSNNPALISQKKLRSQLKGYGVNVIGIINKIEDYATNPPIEINKLLKNQCSPNLPVEFVNASTAYQSSKIFMRWDFADQFAPKCTSFSSPNPLAFNNGQGPYTSAVDLLNRTYGNYIFDGTVFTGRVNCNYSKDSLPIHQYENWSKLYKWFVNGHDFPPYDSSGSGWTKLPAQVTPGGKKLVQTIDTGSWGKAMFSVGPTPTRLDNKPGMFPADILPNRSIISSNAIPDPIAHAHGYWNYTIPAGTQIDTNGFLIPPLQGKLPNGVNRNSYRGNTYLKDLNKTLYAYFFDRCISACYQVKLFEGDSLNGCGNESTVNLPLVGADAYGLGKTGKECGQFSFYGIGGSTGFVFDNSAGNPGTYPNCAKRTMILLNYDSLLDRNDNTPCDLDGFVSFDGTSPLTGTKITPGGLSMPPFFKSPGFNSFNAWSDPNGSVNYTHYVPSGPSQYSNSPIDKNGFVTVGLIIGTGCLNQNCNTPACITDTVWYHNFLHFVFLDASFTYRKKSGYSVYGNNGKLNTQNLMFDTAQNYLVTSTSFPFEPWIKNYAYREPFSNLYGKGDVFEFDVTTKSQDYVKSEIWDWGDGSLTIDSFYYNTQDTFVKLFPANPNDSVFFKKSTYPYQRIRYEFNTSKFPWTITSQSIPFVVGAKATKSIIYDTIYQCWDILHHATPLRIDRRGKVNDSAFYLHPIQHRFLQNSDNRTIPNTNQKANDISSVVHGLVNNNGCSFQNIRHMVFGVMDTFIVKEGNEISDGKVQIGQTIQFVDSIRYWYPKSNGAYNPSRPLSPGEQELLLNDNKHRKAMLLYPLDSLRLNVNPTKYYATLNNNCPTGWQWNEKVNPGISLKTCTKIDTFFFERIYWDFESDGVIDYAGQSPSHQFNQSGNYVVSMITRDSVGYFDTVKTTLQVNGCESFNPFPAVYSFCTENTKTLEVAQAYSLNKWYKNGTNTPLAENSLFYTCKQEGTYRVEARNAANTCFYMDSVNVVFLADASIKQGNTTTFCSNGKDSLVLEPSTLSGYQFLWDNAINSPNLVIKQSEVRQKHILKYSKQNVACYDTITTSFIEPMNLNMNVGPKCIKDSLLLEVKTNLGNGTWINYTWYKDSLNAGIIAPSPHLLVYPNTGRQRIKVVQNFEQCADSATLIVYSNPLYANFISGLTTVKLNETASYSLTLQPNNSYNWKVTGGTIQSGQGTATVSVKWGNTASMGKVEAMIQNANSCLDTSSLLVNIGSVGLKENEQTGFVLFPNPSTDKLTLSSRMGDLFDGTLTITDMAGRVLFEQYLNQKSQQVQIPVSDFPAGLYLLRLNNDKSQAHFIFEKK
ncbi:MAG: T9SS type A sorting domain-containing protein [bacterium]|nr:T9SS type A sorting domain-containing protein [bacterium]